MWNQQLLPLSHLLVPSPPAPPQYQAQIPVLAQHQPASADEIRTLWIGDLQNWMNKAFVSGCFASTGEVVSVKLVRDKQTGQLEGYGFIEFATRATAEMVVQTYNGTLIPNTNQAFRLNWASFSEGERRGGDDDADYNIFVRDLAAGVSDYMLQKTFKSNYPSVKGAKVVTDKTKGRSKGYSFVMFGDANEQARAMTEMHGVYCSSRSMRIGATTAKKAVGDQQQYSTKGYPETLILGAYECLQLRCTSSLIRGLG